jgi:ABC-2 type transport system permease protein
MALFWALIISYGAVLRVVAPADLARMGLTPVQLVWYMVVSEMVVSFGPSYFLEIQEEIRDGAIEIMLLRPVDFWHVKLANWFGQDVLRFTFLMPFCMGLGYFLSGAWGWSLPRLGLLLALMLGGGFLIVCANLIIGCLAVWIGESRPVYWLWSKLVFLLGTLLWPLVFYPAWMQRAAWVTPFPAMLSVPGNLALGEGHAAILRQSGYQVLWLVLMLFACRLAAMAVRRRFLTLGR